MTTDLKRITDRFAASGYLALAPALYRGHGPKITCMIATIRSHFTGRGAAYDDLLAAREYLIADSACTGKVGLAGFCQGAGFCLQLAPSGLFDATAPSYGLLPKDVEKLRQSCPLVASFGANDPIVPRGTGAKLEAVLAKGQVPHDVKEYPDVGRHRGDGLLRARGRRRLATHHQLFRRTPWPTPRASSTPPVRPDSRSTDH